jgi:YD repeat-containing protein
LDISGLPSNAATVTLEYKKGTDQYLVKTANKITNGWFSVSADDMSVGTYQYRLTVDGVVSTGIIEIKRGGQSLPTSSRETKTQAGVVEQTVDRWGNVISSMAPYDRLTTGAPRYTSTYRYNYLNQMIEEKKPTTDIWTASGVDLRSDANVNNDRPTTLYYYDTRGQMIVTQDANGAYNGRRYDEAGQLIAEHRADGSIVKHTYDSYSRETSRIDGVGNRSDFRYDDNDQLIEETSGVNTLWETSTQYAYDEVGNRIRITNGENETTTYFYDALSNVVLTRRPLDAAVQGGLAFEYRSFYDANGKKVREESRLGDYQTWKYDSFGRLVETRDLGGVTTTSEYDSLGRLIKQTNDRVAVTGSGVDQHLAYEYFQDGSIKRIVDYAEHLETVYEIDVAGRRTRERVYDMDSGEVYQDVHILYDELGRIAQLKDTRFTQSYSYDAAGNRRRVLAQYYDVAGLAHTQDNWYAYDATGRMAVTEGVLRNGEIVISATNGEDGFGDTAIYTGNTNLGNNAARQLFVDVNGDGKIDWVTFPTTGGIQVYLNDNKGGFNSTYAFSGLTAVGSDPTRIRLVDITGNGRLDLVYISSTGAVVAYLNNGNGGFNTTATWSFGAVGSDPARHQFIDMNGDGRVDWIRYPTTGGIQVYLNNGTGGFNTTAAFSGLTSVGTDPKRIRLVDTTGNGKLDLVYLPTSGGAVVYLNNGAGGFNTTAAWTGLTALGSDYTRQQFVDVNGDGKADWVSFPTTGGVRVYLNNGSGGFNTTAAYYDLYNIVTDPNRVRLIDASNDGRIDLVYINSNGGASIYRNNGKGGFETAAAWTGLTSLGSDPARQQFVDVNGDGLLDWVSVIATNGAAVYLHGRAQGTELYYDANGNRTIARTYEKVGNVLQRVEDTYHFDAQGRLIETYRGGLLSSVRGYDKAGRQTEYTAYSSPGAMLERRATTYDDNGQQLRQQSYNAANALLATMRYDYADSYDAVGNLKKYTVENATGTRYLQTYLYNYVKGSSYLQSSIDGTFIVYYSKPTTTTGKTEFFYDANGNQTRVTDSQEPNKNRDYIVSSQGQTMQQQQDGKRQYYFYAQGNSVGTQGELDSTEFGKIYSPVGTNYPALSPTSYTVNSGDTLQSIALAVFGDASLWYLIADANGVRTDADLRVGQTLTVPNQIANVHNSSSTFKPFNPGDILGDTSPTLPTPNPPVSSHGHKCGAMAKIIVIVVAAVVAFYTQDYVNTLSWANGYIAAAAGAAAGSAASQVVGMKLGVQDGFSWKAVAVAAATGGATKGIGFGTDPVNAMLTAAARNVIGQGVNIFINPGTPFSWKSVAVAAVTAPVNQSLVPDGQAAKEFDLSNFASNFGRQLIADAVTSVASIAINGKGKLNFAQVAADSFGTALGNSIVADMRQDQRVKALVGPAQKVYQNALNNGASDEDAYKAGLDAQREYIDYTKSRLATVMPRSQSAIDLIYSGDWDFSTQPTGTDSAHTGIVDLVGQRFMGGGRLDEITAFSQLPDQVRLLDGATGGARYIFKLADPETLETVKLFEEAIHGLNGKSTAEIINFSLNMIDNNPNNAAIVGLAMHTLVDSVYHSTYDGNDIDAFLVSKTYEAPLGHGAHLSEPDYMTDFKRDTATQLVAKAFADISGVDQSQYQASLYNALGDVRAADNDGKLLTGAARDEAFKNGYIYATGGERFHPGKVGLSSLLDVFIPGKINITFESDVINTKAFLESTPLRYKNSDEYAAQFLARGLDAAKTISNAYNKQFGTGYKDVTSKSYGQDSGGDYRPSLAPIVPRIAL